MGINVSKTFWLPLAQIYCMQVADGMTKLLPTKSTWLPETLCEVSADSQAPVVSLLRCDSVCGLYLAIIDYRNSRQ